MVIKRANTYKAFRTMINKAMIIITIIQNGFHMHYHSCSCKHAMKQR